MLEGEGAYHYTMDPWYIQICSNYVYKPNLTKIDRDYDFSIILYKFLSFETVLTSEVYNMNF